MKLNWLKISKTFKCSNSYLFITHFYSPFKYFHFRGWLFGGIFITPFSFSRKNTEILCLHPVFNSRSCVSVKSAQPTLVSMTMTVVLQTTLGENCTWGSFRSERSLISWGYVNVLYLWRNLRSLVIFSHLFPLENVSSYSKNVPWIL